MGKADAFDVLEHLGDMRQARTRPARQIDLGDVASDHGGRAKTDAREEHFHLFQRGVLRLVQNDKAVVQRAATHVRQRRDLDHLLLDQLGDLFKAEHLIQRVIQRAQIGVDFLGQIARQKAQLLASFYRRTYQQDAANLLALQGVYRAGDGQVGLAGARRADTEVDVVLLNGAHIILLIGPARLNGHLAGTQDHRLMIVATAVQGLTQALQPRLLQIQVHGIRAQGVIVAGFAVELA